MVSLLVVDDESDLLDALEMILSEAGYQVQATTSSKTALNLLSSVERSNPDLIITDIVMPEVTGLELFKAVRASTPLNETPFLFISAFATPDVETLIATQNKVVFLQKPFEAGDLLRIVDSMM